MYNTDNSSTNSLLRLDALAKFSLPMSPGTTEDEVREAGRIVYLSQMFIVDQSIQVKDIGRL